MEYTMMEFKKINLETKTKPLKRAQLSFTLECLRGAGACRH